MIVYINSEGEIKDVNTTTNSSLKAVEILYDNPFENWSVAKICCYKIRVEEGRVVMMTPYIDTKIIDAISQLGNEQSKLMDILLEN